MLPIETVSPCPSDQEEVGPTLCCQLLRARVETIYVRVRFFDTLVSL